MNNFFAKIISEWLQEEVLESVLLKREVKIPDIKSLNEILAITGPRRAGKTFLMYQIILKIISNKKYTKSDILFIDFEDYRLTGFLPENIDEFFSAFFQLTGKEPKFLFFDEVQHIPNWGRLLRTLHNKRKYKIIISGSNSEMLSKEISTELRGRYSDLLLMPFSFREYLAKQKITFNKQTQYLPRKGEILKAFDDYIKNGAFPEVIDKESCHEKRKLLQNYYNTIFFNDIIERYNVKTKFVLQELMKYGLTTFSSLFSISKFEKYLKTANIPASKSTISNYLHYLENAFFIILNEKFSFSPRKRLMNPSKLYMSDTGFSALGFNFSENRGRLLENIVAIEFFRCQKEVFYYKEKSECDFIMCKNMKPHTAVQVCWELNERNTEREVSALTEVKQKLGTKENFILTYNQEMVVEHKGNKFKVIPVWKWLIYL
jgi:predicted AAA+ superfamily ATPase